MRRNHKIAWPLLIAILVGGPAGAQELFVYPNSGQSPEQQDRDTYECSKWASGQTGFDPSRPPPQASASSQAPGGVGRGAVAGAAGGAVIGAIAGDTGEGAAIGAAAGGLIGGMRRRQHKQQVQAGQQQAMADYNARHASYTRAFAACLEGRNYTVK